jgi:excisionase family DNA binding protein
MEGTKYHRKADEVVRLGIGSRTFDRFVAGKVIPFVRVGRVLLFDPAEVDAALTARYRVAAVGETKRITRRAASNLRVQA